MVKPNFRISEDVDGMIHYDCTGKYSSDNIYGFGIKNPETTDFVKSWLIVKNPLGSEYTVSMNGDMPRTDGIGYLIRPEYVGGKILPGVCTFEYFIQDADGKTYRSGYYKKLMYREAQCCVEKLSNKLDHKLILEGDKYQVKIALLRVSLDAAIWAEKCQRFNEADKIIKTVYKNCQCDCCF